MKRGVIRTIVVALLLAAGVIIGAVAMSRINARTDAPSELAGPTGNGELPGPTGNGAERPITPVTDAMMLYDIDIADSLSRMTEAAQVIVVGRYTEYDSPWDMSVSPHGSAATDGSYASEGRLFRFDVEATLKGSVSGTSILVSHMYSIPFSVTESNAVVDESGIIRQEATLSNEYSFSVRWPLYIEPEMRATYILFLRHHTRNSATSGLLSYYEGIIPSSIMAAPGSIAQLQSNLIGMPPEGFIEQLEVPGQDRTISLAIRVGPSQGLEDTTSGETFESIIGQILSRVRPPSSS